MMKKTLLLCAGIYYAALILAQPSFQTTLQTGISFPLNSNAVNATHAGYGIHFGNHLDYSFGNGPVKFGLGAYIGYLNTLSTDSKYKQIGQAIAQKYNMAVSQLVFNESAFKSTHLLLGPVVFFKASNWNINLWAKGGYGLNEPGRYSVIYKENGSVNNIYINQSGDNKNGLAYSLGGGIQYAVSGYVGLQLAAGYFGTQTDQVNYNFDREKGITPLYYSAKNNFLQASVGLCFTIGKDNGGGHTTRATVNTTRSNIKHQAMSTNDTGADEAADIKIKTKSNIKNDRLANSNTNESEGDGGSEAGDIKIKTKSNIKNDRLANSNTNEGEGSTGVGDIKIKTKSNIKNDRLINNNAGDGTNDNEESDSLFFSPEKIEIRTERQTPKRDFGDRARQPLTAVNNYLTGFAYQTQNGAVLNQCGSSAMDSDPIPGVDVHLKRIGNAGDDILTVRTNKDGSFSFNNIEPGNYNAEVGNTKMEITITGGSENAYQVLDLNSSGACGNVKENYVISADDKLYVEVIAAREASSGMATGRLLPTVNKKEIAIDEPGVQKSIVTPRDPASGLATGKRMHKPFRVSDTDFDVNWNNIVKNDGKLYAEVITAREASHGMATGRSVLVTGDVDGDGIPENEIVSPRDASTGMASGKKHIGNVKYNEFNVVMLREAGSGLVNGKRMHKPFVVVYDAEDGADNYEIVSPRDVATGQSSGKRMHKPFVITKEIDAVNHEIVSPRDAASGLPTGKRMHKPFVVVYDAEDDVDNYEVIAPRDVASGQASGKRMHKPFVITKELDATSPEIVSPRDAASGLPTGKRMHKPFVMMLDDDEDADNDEIVSPRDIATGQSSGKRQHQPVSFVYDGVTYSIIHRDLAARKVLSNDNEQKMAITEQGVPRNKGHKKEMTVNDNTVSDAEDVVSNPLYQGSGNSGVNPLFESKDALTVSGSNGKDHDIFIPSNVTVNLRDNANTVPFTEYAVMPVKWMAPESIAARKGWDGTVKGNSKNINTSESGLGGRGGNSKLNEGNNGTLAKGIQENGIKKNEAVIGNISRFHCSDGTCVAETIVEIDGKEYEAVITGVLKTRHDTVKNSIGNIR